MLIHQTMTQSYSQKRLNQQKRTRDRQRKELENLKRSHFANVRIVQRNLVYVTGLGSRFAKEEVSVWRHHPDAWLLTSRIPVATHSSIHGVFRQVWEDQQDHISQTDNSIFAYTCPGSLHYLSSPRRCRSRHFGSGRNGVSRRRW